MPFLNKYGFLTSVSSGIRVYFNGKASTSKDLTLLPKKSSSSIMYMKNLYLLQILSNVTPDMVCSKKKNLNLKPLIKSKSIFELD